MIVIRALSPALNRSRSFIPPVMKESTAQRFEGRKVDELSSTCFLNMKLLNDKQAKFELQWQIFFYFTFLPMIPLPLNLEFWMQCRNPAGAGRAVLESCTSWVLPDQNPKIGIKVTTKPNPNPTEKNIVNLKHDSDPKYSNPNSNWKKFKPYFNTLMKK